MPSTALRPIPWVRVSETTQGRSVDRPFQGRKLAIATKHEKESVLGPLLTAALGVSWVVPHGLDTDSLGTFSGEILRNLDPLATARKKCLLAMEITGADLAVASEGSFGPHPTLHFVPAGDEIVMLMDRKQNAEIWVRHITTETNFQARTVRTTSELLAFAEEILFPTHGIIIRRSATDYEMMEKGVMDWQTLSQTFDRIRKEHGSVFVESDMRAMYNQ